MLSVKNVFLKKYPGNRNIISIWENSTGTPFEWESINKSTVNIFKDFVVDQYTKNTARVYCSRVKNIINTYYDGKKPLKNIFDNFSMKKDTVNAAYLTNNDIKKLLRYNPKTKSHEIILNLFILGLFTGARMSDYITFSDCNIRGNRLCYTSKKTRKYTEIPTNSVIIKAIKRLEELDAKNCKYSHVYFNKTLKKICYEAGIRDVVNVYIRGKNMTGEKWEFVSSHTARRSFVTNLYIEGVNIFDISMMCGHSSVDMTRNYICCLPRVGKAALKWFNSFNYLC